MKRMNLIQLIICCCMSPALLAASTVYFDTDGTAVVNGQRTFVIGAYRDPTEALYWFPKIRSTGINMIHNYYFEQTFSDASTWIANAQTYLTAAHDAGLGVFLGLPRSVLNAKDNATLTQLINGVKDYDALWFWYLFDEPGHTTTIDVVENAYALVTSVDPDHPTVIVDRGWRMVDQGLLDDCDTFWSDLYGIPYDSMGIKRDLLIGKNAAPAKPVWCVPEAKDRQGLTHRNKSGLYPSQLVLHDDNTCQSYEAIRSQAHACISVNDMQGVTYYWTPPGWHDILETPRVWQGFRTTTNELKALNPALVSTDDVSDVTVTYEEWGTHDRIDELYGYPLQPNEYPTNEHGTYWVRKLNRSVYVGATTTYVPRQRVTIDLPFEFGRIVQYPDQKTIMRKIDASTIQVHEDVSDVLIWSVPDYQTVSFILNDIQSAVWRIDPVDPTETFSYSENFTGTNGTLPTDWSAYGPVNIQGNKLQAAGGSGPAVSLYDDTNYLDWEDFEWTGYIKQSYAFPTASSTESSYFTGLAFKVQNPSNYYLAAVKKKAGSSYPSLVISKVTDGTVFDIADEPMSATWDTLSWYGLNLEVYGSRFECSLQKFSGGPTTTVDAVDTDYPFGSIGVHSVLPGGYTSDYESFSVSGRKLLPNGRCLLAIAEGNRMEFDFNEDCYINSGDLEVIAENWLGAIDGYRHSHPVFSFSEDWESVTAGSGQNNLPPAWTTVTPDGWWMVVTDPSTGSNALYPADSAAHQLQAIYTGVDLSEELDYTAEADFTWDESDWPWTGFAFNIQTSGVALLCRIKGARLIEFNMTDLDDDAYPVSTAMASIDAGAAGWDQGETWRVTASVTHNVTASGELGMEVAVSGYDISNTADTFSMPPAFIDYDLAPSGYSVAQLANGGGFGIVSRANRDHYVDNIDVNGHYVDGPGIIDLKFFADFARAWMECNDPVNESCFQ